MSLFPDWQKNKWYDHIPGAEILESDILLKAQKQLRLTDTKAQLLAHQSLPQPSLGKIILKAAILILLAPILIYGLFRVGKAILSYYNVPSLPPKKIEDQQKQGRDNNNLTKEDENQQKPKEGNQKELNPKRPLQNTQKKPNLEEINLTLNLELENLKIDKEIETALKATESTIISLIGSDRKTVTLEEKEALTLLHKSNPQHKVFLAWKQTWLKQRLLEMMFTANAKIDTDLLTFLYNKIGDELSNLIHENKEQHLLNLDFVKWALFTSTTLFENGLKSTHSSNWLLSISRLLNATNTPDKRRQLCEALFKMTDPTVKLMVAKQLIFLFAQKFSKTKEEQEALFNACNNWLQDDFAHCVPLEACTNDIFLSWALTNSPEAIVKAMQDEQLLVKIVSILASTSKSKEGTTTNYAVFDPLFKINSVDLSTKQQIACEILSLEGFNEPLANYLQGLLGDAVKEILSKQQELENKLKAEKDEKLLKAAESTIESLISSDRKTVTPEEKKEINRLHKTNSLNKILLKWKEKWLQAAIREIFYSLETSIDTDLLTFVSTVLKWGKEIPGMINDNTGIKNAAFRRWVISAAEGPLDIYLKNVFELPNIIKMLLSDAMDKGYTVFDVIFGMDDQKLKISLADEILVQSKKFDKTLFDYLYSKLGDEFLQSINKRKYFYLNDSQFLEWALLQSPTLFVNGLKGRDELCFKKKKTVDQWSLTETIQTLLLNKSEQERQPLIDALLKITDSDIKRDVAKQLVSTSMQDATILPSIVSHYLDHNDYTKLDPLFNIDDIAIKQKIVKSVMPDSFNDKLMTYLYSKLGIELVASIPANYVEQNSFLHYVLSSKPELLTKVLNFVPEKSIFSLITKLTLEEELKKYFIDNKDLLSHLGSWCSSDKSFIENALPNIDQKSTKEMIEFLFKSLTIDDFKALIFPLGQTPYSSSMQPSDMALSVPSIIHDLTYENMTWEDPKKLINHLRIFTEIDGGCLFRELKLITWASKVESLQSKTEEERNKVRLIYLKKLYEISPVLFVEESNKAPNDLSNLARDDKNQDLETWLKEINLWQDKTE